MKLVRYWPSHCRSPNPRDHYAAYYAGPLQRVLFLLWLRLRFSRSFRLLRFGLFVTGRACTRSTIALGFISSRSFFVTVATVIGLIKSRAFEDDCCAGTKQASQLFFPAFRTFCEVRCVDPLEFFKCMFTSVTYIIVGWHSCYTRSKIVCE